MIVRVRAPDPGYPANNIIFCLPLDFKFEIKPLVSYKLCGLGLLCGFGGGETVIDKRSSICGLLIVDVPNKKSFGKYS